jgi:hypothetical protein
MPKNGALWEPGVVPGINSTSLQRADHTNSPHGRNLLRCHVWKLELLLILSGGLRRIFRFSEAYVSGIGNLLMIQPGFEFVYEAAAGLGAPISMGETPDGTRRIIPILEGRVEGPMIRGELIGGGADWQLTRPDSVTVVNATYALRTDDGVVIQIRNRGLRHGPPEVMAALAGGREVDPKAYYFRTTLEFIAPEGRYEWLNRSIFVCTGAGFPQSIRLWVWRVT